MKNVLFSILLLAAVSCNSQPGTTDIHAGPDEFEKGLSSPGVQVLDVRKATEFKGGHLKNALQADWTNKAEFFERVKYVDKDKPVYIYCLAGGRSAAAAGWMRENGYKQVIELTGGINAWKNAGKPVEGSSNEKQISEEEYLASIPADKTVLVDVGAEWCPPCVKMEPVLNEIRADSTLHFVFLKIDAGIHTGLLKALQIESLPVFIIYKGGKETWRKQGLVSRDEFSNLLK
ncbi:MAG: thioredoxin [Sphingobacteriales bacterium]|nr:thioredoxin [Sphingobacteriales bacterium]